MYLTGEDFEYEIDGITEDFSCIDNVIINDKEYVIAENEYGLRHVFLYDTTEEELIMVDEEEEEGLLDAYDNGEYDKNEESFGNWDDDNEYYEDDYEDEDLENSYSIENFDDEEIDEKEIEDFLESLF